MITKDFKISMLYDDCTLRVLDETNYDDSYTALLDYIVYIPEHKILEESVRLISPIVNNIYKFNPIQDGRYVFNRVVLKIFSVDEYIIPGNEGHLPLFKQKFRLLIPANTYFIWNNGIYFTDNHGVDVKELTRDGVQEWLRSHIKNEVNSAEGIYEFDTIEDLVNWAEDNSTEHAKFDKEFYSICSLNSCVANAQKKWLLKNINTCGDKCSKSDETSAQRDFLFITSYVLDYLVSIGDYDQADDILSQIKTSCNNICDDENKTSSKSCGCNVR